MSRSTALGYLPALQLRERSSIATKLLAERYFGLPPTPAKARLTDKNPEFELTVVAVVVAVAQKQYVPPAVTV